MAVRYTIVFTGNVQGVGFRYTTENIAQSYDITGWVRNEPDGSVSCVAEGEQRELERFVASVREAMSRYIGDAQIKTSAATSEFRSFGVRR